MTPDKLYSWWQEAYPAVILQLTEVMENLPPSILARILSSSGTN
jgi:hypothetical protein